MTKSVIKAITLTFMTGNASKLKEMRSILKPTFEVIQKNIDLPEYQGEPNDVARAKCKAATELVEGPVIVEDTSLCFNAHGGLPGPYVKWYLKKIGADGLYRMLHGFDDKSAYAMCIYAYGSRDSEIKLFKGRCDGTIVKPRGSLNFGWDPIFQPNGYEKTYAEMDEAEKNKISPRALALEELRLHLVSDGD